jgi:hypothetical protein
VARLTYSEDDLLQSHPYARPHVVAGHRLHGGFDEAGRYVPPRLLHRGPAVDAWSEALRARGGDLLPADASLLAGIRFPSVAQQKLLIQRGLGQTFWNSLTIIGHIEARGRILADMAFPDLQSHVVEDVSGMGVGHLNRGLLKAHGLDEGGEPRRGIGGHDVMWFALRDLAFGPPPWPEPEIPDNIARPDAEAEVFPQLHPALTRTVYFLANLLMIEFRAELGFSSSEALLQDPELFTERRAEAEEAAEVVNRIRTDEAIHVRSLRLYLGELAELTLKTRDGGTLPGRELVDSLWEGIVHWATREQPRLAAERQRRILTGRILAHPDGREILRAFEALEEREEPS